MRFVFVGYHYSQDIHSPQDWLDRVKIYVGSLECLSREHTVIRVEQINYTGNFSHNGVQYYCVDYGKKKEYFPLKLNAFVKHLRPDIIIVNGLHFPLQLIQLRLRLGKKVKIIAQNHAERPFKGIKKYLQLLADKYINAYFFASHATGVEWVRNGNIRSEKKIHEIMEVSSVFYPVDKNIAKSKTKVNGDTVFLWAGRLNKNKDPETVLSAFLKFLQFWPGARLYMIYQTAELLPGLKRMINEKKEFSDAVILVGRVPHGEMLYWFNSADFIISGSHHEGSGTAICEAMSCGCIPVITDIDSFRTMTGNDECGFLYKAGDEKELLSVLVQTIKLNTTEMKIRTLQQFKNELSFEAIAAKIQQVAASL